MPQWRSGPRVRGGRAPRRINMSVSCSGRDGAGGLPDPMSTAPNGSVASWTRDEDPGSGQSAAVRLTLLSCVSAAGSLGGVFVISAVIVMEPLRTRGNAFLVSSALAHLLVSALLLPSTCVAILAGVTRDPGLCHFQWALLVVCLVASLLSFACLAASQGLALRCSRGAVLAAALASWAVAATVALGQRGLGLGPTFCGGAPVASNVPLQAAVAALCILVPVLLTVLGFGVALARARRHEPDGAALELLKSHVAVYLLTLAMWVPGVALAAVSLSRQVPPHLVDVAWWLALSHSCLYSYVYAATHRTFRVAFNKLFFYCCCKSHVTFSRPSREQRIGPQGSGVGLRVHIIPAMNIYSAKKDSSQAAVKHCVQGKGLHCSYDL